MIFTTQEDKDQYEALSLKAADRDEWQQVAMKVSAERDELQAKLARTEHEYQAAMNSIAIYDKTNGELLAKLDASERANAERREALLLCTPCPYCGFNRSHDVGCKVARAISSDAGRDYVHRSEVEALKLELAKYHGKGNQNP